MHPCTYRETEQQILTSTDSIIAHLEDHMVKTHNMRGSPYFKAFEGKHMCSIEVMIIRKLNYIILIAVQFMMR